MNDSLSRVRIVAFAIFALGVPAFPAVASHVRCGQPVTTGVVPKASDALSVLRSAVGTVPCLKCVCDVDRSGTITAPDALRVLRKAVSQPVTIQCVDCLASAVIGAAGGIVTSHDGRLELAIPPGALDTPTEITIDGAAPSSLPDSFDDAFVYDAYELGPDGATFDPPIEVTYHPPADTVSAEGTSVTFDYPLLVTEAGGEPEDLVGLIARYDLETDEAQITGTLAHFSPLAVLSEIDSGITFSIENFPAERDVKDPPFDAKMVVSTTLDFLDLAKPVHVEYRDEQQCGFLAYPVNDNAWTEIASGWEQPIQGKCQEGDDEICRVEFKVELHQEYSGFPADLTIWIDDHIKCTGDSLALLFPRTEIEEPFVFEAPLGPIGSPGQLAAADAHDQILGVGTADGSTAYNLDQKTFEFDMTNEPGVGHYGGFPLRSCNPECSEAWIQYGPSSLSIWNWDPKTQSFGEPATSQIFADDAYPVAPSADGFASSAYVANTSQTNILRIGFADGEFKVLGNVVNGQVGIVQSPGSVFPFPNGALMILGLGNAFNKDGKLQFHAGTNPAATPTSIGEVGLYPRRVRCAQCTGASTNWTCVNSASFSSELFVSQINPATGVGSITDTKTTGNTPYGVAIRAKAGANGCWAIVSDLGEAGYEMCDIGNDGKAACEHVALPAECSDARFVTNLLDGRFIITCQNHELLVPIADPDLP